MAGQKTLSIKVLNQKGVVYDGIGQVLFVPAKKDEVAILPEHTPLIMLLTKGSISIVIDGQKKLISPISHGVLYVGQNEASVLVNE